MPCSQASQLARAVAALSQVAGAAVVVVVVVG